jgi:hypothetical protein
MAATAQNARLFITYSSLVNHISFEAENCTHHRTAMARHNHLITLLLNNNLILKQ